MTQGGVNDALIREQNTVARHGVIPVQTGSMASPACVRFSHSWLTSFLAYLTLLAPNAGRPFSFCPAPKQQPARLAWLGILARLYRKLENAVEAHSPDGQADCIPHVCECGHMYNECGRSSAMLRMHMKFRHRIYREVTGTGSIEHAWTYFLQIALLHTRSASEFSWLG